MVNSYPANTDREVSPSDRLSFALFLAAALHTALLFGVTFDYVSSQTVSKTLEVTLAQHRIDDRPDDPDYLAQINQIESGSSAEKQLLASTADPSSVISQIGAAYPKSQRWKKELNERQDNRVISSQPSLEKQLIHDKRLVDKSSQQPEPIISNSFKARAFEIVNLEAKLERQNQIFTNMPRVKRITSLSTAASADAFYLNSWRRKIEKVGNLNYPVEARKRKLYGSLRLLVAIEADGSLRRVKILESSGHKMLDDAAVRIVRLSAPFAPFPDELRATTDLLEIIRTWQFRKNSSMGSY
tara:strand:- start:623 stop:1519 length:897 start_codon:yes stop_codon:yes gene_type:complete